MSENPGVLFGILGSVEVRHPDGTVQGVDAPRTRALLALLLLDAGRIVPSQRLVDGLYGERPPNDASNALQALVSRLRRKLRDDCGLSGAVEHHPAGYRLVVDPDEVDAHRFARLAEAAKRAEAPDERAELLDEALALWRGPALADVADEPFAAPQIARLEEARLAAIEDFRELGERWGTAQALDGLATLADARGAAARALSLTDEALDLVDQLGAREELADMRCRRADRLLRAGDHAAAQADYEQAMTLARATGLPSVLAAARLGLGEIARLRGELAKAREWCELALDACARDWTNTTVRATVHTTLGRLAEADGNAAEAREHHHTAVAAALANRTMPALANAVEGLAGLSVLERDGARAALLLGIARTVRGEAGTDHPDRSRIVAACRDLIADYDAAFDQGAALGYDRAIALLTEETASSRRAG
jgi:DNA-binding SARP family transcriptional activator